MSGWLCHIAVPDYGSVIVDGSSVVQFSRKVREGLQRNGKKLIGLDAFDAEKSLDEIESAVEEAGDQITRGGHQKCLANGAVQCALHLASSGKAKIQDGRKTAGGPHNVAVLRCGRDGADRQAGDEQYDDLQGTFHENGPFQDSVSGSLRHGAQGIPLSLEEHPF